MNELVKPDLGLQVFWEKAEKFQANGSLLTLQEPCQLTPGVKNPVVLLATQTYRNGGSGREGSAHLRPHSPLG